MQITVSGEVKEVVKDKDHKVGCKCGCHFPPFASDDVIPCDRCCPFHEKSSNDLMDEGICPECLSKKTEEIKIEHIGGQTENQFICKSCGFTATT